MTLLMAGILTMLGAGGGGSGSAGTNPGSPSNYWKIDSWTTTTAASVGAVSLSVSGSPTSVAGIQGNGADCPTGVVGFTSSDVLFQLGDTDFTWALWFKVSGANPIILDTKGGGDTQGYRIQADTVNGAGFYCQGAGGSGTVTYGTPYTANAWQLIVAAHDSVNNLLKVSQNGGAFASVAYSFGTSGTNPLQFGRFFGTPVTIDELGLWKAKVFINSEALYLWNGGAGRTY